MKYMYWNTPSMLFGQQQDSCTCHDSSHKCWASQNKSALSPWFAPPSSGFTLVDTTIYPIVSQKWFP